MIRIDTRVLLALGLGAFLVAGCGDDSGRPRMDSGTRDTGTTDSGDRDSGVVLMDGGTDTSLPPGDSGADTALPPGDSGTSMCPSGACDLVTNSGCGTGEACYFLSSSADAGPTPICQPAGTAGDGASCSSYGDCQEGFICDSTDGVCRHYCCTGSDMGCPLGQTCSVSLAYMDVPTGVGYCKLPDMCDLLAQTGCPAGQNCYPSGDGVSCNPSTDDATEGASCLFTNTCAGGLICINDPGVCAKLCDRDMAGGPTCAASQTCGGVTGLPSNVGVCTPPAGG